MPGGNYIWQHLTSVAGAGFQTTYSCYSCYLCVAAKCGSAHKVHVQRSRHVSSTIGQACWQFFQERWVCLSCTALQSVAAKAARLLTSATRGGQTWCGGPSPPLSLLQESHEQRQFKLRCRLGQRSAKHGWFRSQKRRHAYACH